MEERRGLVEDPVEASVAAKKAAEEASEVNAVATEEADPMRVLPGVEAKTPRVEDSDAAFQQSRCNSEAKTRAE